MKSDTNCLRNENKSLEMLKLLNQKVEDDVKIGREDMQK